MSEVWTAVFGLVKVVCFVFDLVAYIPSYIIYRPDKVLKKSRRIKAVRVSDDYDAPYRSVDLRGDLTVTLFPECSTLDDLFDRAVHLHPTKPCLGTRELIKEEDELQPNGRVFKKVVLGDYTWLNYQQVFERVSNFGSGLLALGQTPKKNIVLFAETRAEWMIAAQACFKYNFPVVTLYATLGQEAIIHGINETEAKFVITSTDLLMKFSDIMARMPSIETLIVMNNGQKLTTFPNLPNSVKVFGMNKVEEIGGKPENINSPMTKPSREDIAVIMYTSGSTGLPKGVLISHGNLMCGMSGQCERIPNLAPPDIYIGYLPLAHVLELSAEISCVAHGVSIGYSSPLTLTDQSSKIKRGSKGDVSVLKPTLMAAVPVIMDRIYKGVQDKVSSGGSFAKAFFDFAYSYKKTNLERGFNTPLFNRFVFSKISHLLGGRIRMMLSGGAPLSEATHRFMNICFCCPVSQGYGLTETCGAGTVSEATDLRTGHVGAPLLCSEFRLRDWPEGNYTNKDTPYPRGEILVGGGNVAMGYYLNDAKTKEDFITISGTRYFCSGDIGLFDSEGCLSIIDRKKDLVKLQTGEYISLSKVETVLKMSPLVDQICLCANSFQLFPVAIIVPNQKNLIKLAATLGFQTDDFQALCQNKDLCKEVTKALSKHGLKSMLDKFEIPQSVYLLTEAWTPETGLVTDAYKLKRKKIDEKFETEIASLYK